MPEAEGSARTAPEFDETFDVVVVGYGFAGGVSAIEAARSGAKLPADREDARSWRHLDLLARGDLLHTRAGKGSGIYASH